MKMGVLNESWVMILDEDGFLWMTKLKVSNSKDAGASAWDSL